MKKDEEYAKARVKDIKKAHEDGCDDVKQVLENMYPDLLNEEYCCRWMGNMVECGVFKDHGGHYHGIFKFSIEDIEDKNLNNLIYFCPRCGKKLM